MSSKRHKVFTFFMLLLLAGGVFLGMVVWRSGNAGAVDPGDSGEDVAEVGGASAGEPRVSALRLVGTGSGTNPGGAVAATADQFIAEMDALELTHQGRKLALAKRAVAARAMEALDGMELVRFFNHRFEDPLSSLSHFTIQANTIDRIMGAQGVDRREVLEWAMNLDDLNLRSRILGTLGEHIEEHELEYVLPQLGARPASELLRDYCRKLAQTDAEKAVESFIRLRPRGVDFGELGRIMGAMPPETDFAAIDALIPDDTQGNARGVRSSLLRRWASVDPQAALDYVAANPERVATDQMDVVLARWASVHPRRAEDWVQQQTDPGLRSQGAHAMSTILENQSPGRAWDWALEIQDHDLQEERLTQIHEVWSRHNPQAADEALAALYE